MKNRLAEHIIGIIFVSLLMLGAVIILNGRAGAVQKRQHSAIATLNGAPVTKINDPFERALLADCMDIYYPARHDSNSVILEEFFRVKEQEFNALLHSTSGNQPFSWSTFVTISGMYAKFMIIYCIVMLLTYYGVQTLGALRFILHQQTLQRDAARRPGEKSRPSYTAILLNAAKIVAYVVLFSPAYVIAYSIRTEFNTDSSFFMVILGVISNGLLVMYTNKFYTFLVAESRKGYIENALVKNLCADYRLASSRGITWRALLSLDKRFQGHVFDQIYQNARHQYLSTIKEQASFLITGLVIIEMALNIHGHLTYELLRQLLYNNYTSVIMIMLFIFYTVKLTDIVTDSMVHRESRRYENR